MLTELNLSNFVIVERARLDFSAGFTAITGETGAGKSIILDALGLLLGDKADYSSVRAGKDEARISASFDLSGLPKAKELLAQSDLLSETDENQLLIRRVIERKGKSRQYVNDSPCSLAQLKALSPALVDVHGQNERQALSAPTARREFLDAYAGLGGLAAQTAALHDAWKTAQTALESAQNESAARKLELENLDLKLRDFDNLRPKAGEYRELSDRYNTLAHGADILEAAGAVAGQIAGDNGMQSRIGRGMRQLERFAEFNPEISDALAILSSLDAEMSELSQILGDVAESIDLDPAELNRADARLAAYNALGRKRNADPEALFELWEELKQRRSAAQDAIDLTALAKKEKEAFERFKETAARLSAGRAEAAQEMGAKIESEMRKLAMPGARFVVELEPAEPYSGGLENVQFLVAVNKGMEPRPMSQVASGGELSRISLAAQVVAGRRSSAPTLIFDEVDAGIGGSQGEVVGRSLKALGARCQTLAITHLPQVASFADAHWKISKGELDGLTTSRADYLAGEERAMELARMMAGETITDLTLAHAKELLERSQGADPDSGAP